MQQHVTARAAPCGIYYRATPQTTRLENYLVGFGLAAQQLAALLGLSLHSRIYIGRNSLTALLSKCFNKERKTLPHAPFLPSWNAIVRPKIRSTVMVDLQRGQDTSLVYLANHQDFRHRALPSKNEGFKPGSTTPYEIT